MWLIFATVVAMGAFGTLAGDKLAAWAYDGAPKGEADDRAAEDEAAPQSAPQEVQDPVAALGSPEGTAGALTENADVKAQPLTEAIGMPEPQAAPESA